QAAVLAIKKGHTGFRGRHPLQTGQVFVQYIPRVRLLFARISKIRSTDAPCPSVHRSPWAQAKSHGLWAGSVAPGTCCPSLSPGAPVYKGSAQTPTGWRQKEKGRPKGARGQLICENRVVLGVIRLHGKRRAAPASSYGVRIPDDEL